MSSPFTDTSLDDRARPIVATIYEKVPDESTLRRVAELEEEASPASLEDSAQWLLVLDDLATAGLTRAELLRVALRAHVREFEVFGPGIGVLAYLFADEGCAAIARAVCEAALVDPVVTEDRLVDDEVVIAALARLAADGEFDARFDPLVTLDAPPTELRAIFAALPISRREARALELARLSTEEDGAWTIDPLYQVDKLLWLADLVATPAVIAARATLLAARKDSESKRLAKEIRDGTVRQLEPRPTKSAMEALATCLDEKTKATRAADINRLAEAKYFDRDFWLAVDAPELATVAAWIAAGSNRQKQIAIQVQEALAEYTAAPCKVVEIKTFGGPPIAILQWKSQRFALVPGGAFELGLSKEEEATVRARALINEGIDHYYEMYERLFENISKMRPLTRVCVGPMLVAQGPGEVHEPHEATDALASSPFRLPTEAEWEYCSRGGKARELTYRGNVVPDHEDWFIDAGELGVKSANAFGLWGFGFEMEVCTDAHAITHDDAPVDGTPRRGTGKRVVRGGAARLSPWVGAGEWHMLLNAFRMSSNVAVVGDLAIALRFVLGIDCGARPS